MIFYDWAKLYRKTEGSASRIVTTVAYITFPSLPKNRYDPTYHLSYEDWSGDSFLLHPEKILSNRSKFNDTELAEYIALASFRSYAEYVTTGKRTLSEILCPVKLNDLKNNRLLTFQNGEIYFCWEEVTH